LLGQCWSRSLERSSAQVWASRTIVQPLLPPARLPPPPPQRPPRRQRRPEPAVRTDRSAAAGPVPTRDRRAPPRAAIQRPSPSFTADAVSELIGAVRNPRTRRGARRAIRCPTLHRNAGVRGRRKRRNPPSALLVGSCSAPASGRSHRDRCTVPVPAAIARAPLDRDPVVALATFLGLPGASDRRHSSRIRVELRVVTPPSRGGLLTMSYGDAAFGW